MSRKKQSWVDKIVYHLTKKPEGYKKVKDPPKTAAQKLLRMNDARQQQYNDWYERNVLSGKTRRTKEPAAKKRENPQKIKISKGMKKKRNYANIKKKVNKEEPSKKEAIRKISSNVRETLQQAVMDTINDSRKKLIDLSLVAEMEKNKIKFTKENLVFVTKDKTGQMVFLETGKEDAGLKHIQQRHTREFFETFNVEKENIPIFLYKVVNEGDIVDNHIEIRNGRQTITKVYDYQGKYYILTGVGTNGFIVTARPAKKE